MKILKCISFFIVITLCFTNTQCDTDDNDFRNEINITNNTIVAIENNQTDFALNETIVIQTTILNSQTSIDGQNLFLTDYDYAEVGQSQYQFELKLYKLTSFNTIAEIPLTLNSITTIEGETLIDNDAIVIRSFFDGTSYKNKFSISSTETGTFYLAGSNFINNNGMFYINGGIYERADVFINSTIVNANTNGAYEFVVN